MNAYLLIFIVLFFFFYPTNAVFSIVCYAVPSLIIYVAHCFSQSDKQLPTSEVASIFPLHPSNIHLATQAAHLHGLKVVQCESDESICWLITTVLLHCPQTITRRPPNGPLIIWDSAHRVFITSALICVCIIERKLDL